MNPNQKNLFDKAKAYTQSVKDATLRDSDPNNAFVAGYETAVREIKQAYEESEDACDFLDWVDVFVHAKH
ncbi:MAG: hypothetical protein RR346_11965 [Bacteroidales bacterium]